MNKKDVLDCLKKFINDNEWEPQIIVPKKELRKSKFGTEYKSFPEIKYTITKDLLSLFKKYSDVVDMTAKKDNKLIKFYVITDGSIKRIGITKSTVNRSFINQLIKYFKGDKSLFNDFVNFKDIKVEMVKCFKENDCDADAVYKSLCRKYKVKQFISKEYLKQYNDIINDILNVQFSTKKSYPFLIINTIRDYRFIGTTKHKCSRKKVMKTVTTSYPEIKNDINKQKHKFAMKWLDDITYRTDVERDIKIDHLIEKYNSVNKGYNERYKYIKKSLNKQKLFLDINKDIAIGTVYDEYDYSGTNGFIYVVRNKINDRKFIGVGKTTLIDSVTDMYQNRKISSELYNDLHQYPFTDFSIEILKFKRDKNTDLSIEAGKLIERYKTFENGYNK